MLKNYRTYICAALLGITTAAHALGYISDQQFLSISGFLGAGGLGFLRASLPAK